MSIVPKEMTPLHRLLSWMLLQALPQDKKPLSAELFWLTFRLYAGLPLSPRDSHAEVDSSLGESDTLRQLFEDGDTQRHGNREMALLMLCSFAEGGFTRPKNKKSRVRGMQGICVSGGVFRWWAKLWFFVSICCGCTRLFKAILF